MPRSFLVKKNFNRKKPNYGELETKAGVLPGDAFASVQYCAIGLVWDLRMLPALCTTAAAAADPHMQVETSSSPSSHSSSGDEEESGRTSDPPSPEGPRCQPQRAKRRVGSASATPSEPAYPRTSFSCKHCAKEYGSLGALKMHIRSHTLPCVCPTCGKAFSRPWLLRGHIRTHTGERPFSCPHCNRAFADRSNLRAHLQTHEDVKRYQCSSCSRTFSRASLLHKHSAAGCTPNHM
ncbi:hypothetical protein GN956_G6968 [Arapaima gigas]